MKVTYCSIAECIVRMQGADFLNYSMKVVKEDELVKVVNYYSSW